MAIQYFRYNPKSGQWIEAHFANDIESMNVVLLMRQNIHDGKHGHVELTTFGSAEHVYDTLLTRYMIWSRGMSEPQLVKRFSDEGAIMSNGNEVEGLFAPIELDIEDKYGELTAANFISQMWAKHKRRKEERESRIANPHAWTEAEEHLAYIPFLWSVRQDAEDNTVDIALDLVRLKMEEGKVLSDIEKLHWTINIDYAKRSIVSNPDSFKDDVSCIQNNVKTEGIFTLLYNNCLVWYDTLNDAAKKIEIPRVVTKAALEILKNEARMELNSEPCHAEKMAPFGKGQIYAFIDRPLDTSAAYFRNKIDDFDDLCPRTRKDNFDFMCNTFQLDCTSSNLKKLYHIDPAGFMMYAFWSSLGIHDEAILSPLLDYRYFLFNHILSLSYTKEKTFSWHRPFPLHPASDSEMEDAEFEMSASVENIKIDEENKVVWYDEVQSESSDTYSLADADAPLVDSGINNGTTDAEYKSEDILLDEEIKASQSDEVPRKSSYTISQADIEALLYGGAISEKLNDREDKISPEEPRRRRMEMEGYITYGHHWKWVEEDDEEKYHFRDGEGFGETFDLLYAYAEWVLNRRDETTLAKYLKQAIEAGDYYFRRALNFFSEVMNGKNDHVYSEETKRLYLDEGLLAGLASAQDELEKWEDEHIFRRDR